MVCQILPTNTLDVYCRHLRHVVTPHSVMSLVFLAPPAEMQRSLSNADLSVVGGVVGVGVNFKGEGPISETFQ